MTTEQALEAVLNEVNRARAKYPSWPDNIVMAAAIASEESGEVVRSCNSFHWQQGDDSPADIMNEAIQAAAMWIRFLVDSPLMYWEHKHQAEEIERKEL